jgi:hypothetical protein
MEGEQIFEIWHNKLHAVSKWSVIFSKGDLHAPNEEESLPQVETVNTKKCAGFL